MKALFSSHVLPLIFQATEREKSHSLDQGPKMKFREFVLTLQAQGIQMQLWRSTGNSVKWSTDFRCQPFRYSEEIAAQIRFNIYQISS